MERVGQNVSARMGVTEPYTVRQSTFLIVLRKLDECDDFYTLCAWLQRHTLKEMLGIYQPYEYSWLFLSNSTKYIWQLIKNISAIVIDMFGIHIQAELIQANLGFR